MLARREDISVRVGRDDCRKGGKESDVKLLKSFRRKASYLYIRSTYALSPLY